MNKFFYVGLIGIVFLFFSCSKNEEKNALKIGKITEIKSGKTVTNSQYGLSLRVRNISDSRCPIGVMCVWEGNASVEFHLTTKKGEYDFTLDTHHPPNFKNDTMIESIKYELKDVLPYPGDGKKLSKQTVKILVKVQ